MAILSPKPDLRMAPHFLSARLVPLVTDRTKETIRMSHILIGAAGLNRRQIDAVPLDRARVAALLRALVARFAAIRP